MSSRQRKRPGGAVGSSPAQKRSRLLPSSAGGTSQTEPRDLEESGAPAFEPDLTGDDTIDLTGEEVIDLTCDGIMALTGDDIIDLKGEEIIDLTGDDTIDLIGDDTIDITGEEVMDLTGEDVIDLTGKDIIDFTDEDTTDLRVEDTIDITGGEVIDLTDEDVIDLTGEDTIDLTGEEVIDLTDEDIIDLTGDDTIDLTGEDIIDLTGEDTIDITGEEVIDLTGEDIIDLTGEDVIDLTGESSELEVITISDDESPVDREQSQQQPHPSRASEISVAPLARNDEEEPIEDDDARPAGPASPPMREGDNSQVQDREQSQQYPLGSREAESSAELRASDNEEEPRDNDAWTAHLISPPNSENDSAENWQQPLGSREGENAAEVLANDSEEEPQDIELPSGSLLCVICMSCYSQLLEVYRQKRRRATLKRHGQVDGSGNGTGANDAPVADSAPAEQGAAEEGPSFSGSVPSSAQQGVVISCPICMDSYSEIMQSGRLIVATMCGHVFCSECLPVALETIGVCPTCRVELTPDLYHPIYL